ncbi:hypothetical protein DY000_02044224 [Brassica cretica]|uniref:Uncharacterized protein n=1 Tax=Brassica cretica TaxID=69181 RepID=A0ABQ7EVJ6_BRACR|nr:hypothetical protein DY000_02044224 [Brassica cretica]
MARGSWFGTCLEALISSQINWIDIVVSFISTSVIVRPRISIDTWFAAEPSNAKLQATPSSPPPFCSGLLVLQK